MATDNNFHVDPEPLPPNPPAPPAPPAPVVPDVTPDQVKAWIGTILKVANVVLSVVPGAEKYAAIVKFVEGFATQQWVLTLVTGLINLLRSKHAQTEDEIKAEVVGFLKLNGLV